MSSTVKQLKKIEIIQEQNGGVGLYVNGEKVDITNTLGINLDVRYDDGVALIEVTTRNRVCILNYGDKIE